MRDVGAAGLEQRAGLRAGHGRHPRLGRNPLVDSTTAAVIAGVDNDRLAIDQGAVGANVEGRVFPTSAAHRTDLHVAHARGRVVGHVGLGHRIDFDQIAVVIPWTGDLRVAAADVAAGARSRVPDDVRTGGADATGEVLTARPAVFEVAVEELNVLFGADDGAPGAHATRAVRLNAGDHARGKRIAQVVGRGRGDATDTGDAGEGVARGVEATVVAAAVHLEKTGVRVTNHAEQAAADLFVPLDRVLSDGRRIPIGGIVDVAERSSPRSSRYNASARCISAAGCRESERHQR